MGFLAPKPKVNVVEQKPAPTIDDDSVRHAGEAEARRMAARRDTGDTILTAPRAGGGLARAFRQAIGG